MPERNYSGAGKVEPFRRLIDGEPSKVERKDYVPLLVGQQENERARSNTVDRSRSEIMLDSRRRQLRRSNTRRLVNVAQLPLDGVRHVRELSALAPIVPEQCILRRVERNFNGFDGAERRARMGSVFGQRHADREPAIGAVHLTCKLYAGGGCLRQCRSRRAAPL